MSTMSLELRISGLCVVVLHAKQSGGNRPAKPDSVEILCAKATHSGHEHAARFSYWPVDRSSGEAGLGSVHPDSGKHGVIDWQDKDVKLTVSGGSPPTDFHVEWAASPLSSPAVLGPTSSERWFDWVPRVEHLGLASGIKLSSTPLPAGASARLVLPPGKLWAASIARDAAGAPIPWDLPATAGPRVQNIANDVVYRVDGITKALFEWKEGTRAISTNFNWFDGRVVHACLSNDRRHVPDTYLVPQTELDDLDHLNGMAANTTEAVKPPKVNTATVRTGWPICNQALYVNLTP